MNDSLSKVYPMIDYDVLIFGEIEELLSETICSLPYLPILFFQSAIAQRVNERAADSQMLFAQYGLTLRDKKAPSVFFVKKLKNTLNHVYGYAVFIDLIPATSESFSICSKSRDIEDLLHERRTDDHRIK